MTTVAASIAKIALDHYDRILPTKGKPKENEWTVYAALVATSTSSSSNDNRRWVVSCATGTKCTAARNDQGCILHDSHAEVLTRRGLVRVLWKEIVQLQKQEQSNTKSSPSETGTASDDNLILEASPSPSTSTTAPNQFRLRSSVRLHLYISDSPCGDASIYALGNNQDGDNDESNNDGKVKDVVQGGLQFTGAKVIVSTATKVDTAACGGDHQLLEGSGVAREDIQLLGKLRTKSGRSNLEADRRSTSMSCSDKLARWSVAGLQGTFLSAYIALPITLSSVVVSRDNRVVNPGEQLWALERAIPDRVAAVMQTLDSAENLKEFSKSLVLPSVSIVEAGFSWGKSTVDSRQEKHDSARKRKREDESTVSAPSKFSPCGLSINWQLTDRQQEVELTVGARGIRHGKKPKSSQDYHALRSRLCRGVLVEWAQESGLAIVCPMTYAQWKVDHGLKVVTDVTKSIVRKGPLAGWLVGGGDFEIRPVEHDGKI
jgi:tRNA-specific adenosine deaminase 1